MYYSHLDAKLIKIHHYLSLLIRKRKTLIRKISSPNYLILSTSSSRSQLSKDFIIFDFLSIFASYFFIVSFSIISFFIVNFFIVNFSIASFFIASFSIASFSIASLIDGDLSRYEIKVSKNSFLEPKDLQWLHESTKIKFDHMYHNLLA